MRLTLVTESTYPHFQGGVSVWCDQLVRSLPDYEFDLYAITDTSGRVPVWDLPPNVGDTRSVAIWEPAKPGRRRAAGNADSRILAASEELLVAVFADPRQGSSRFLNALHAIAGLAPGNSLSSVIRSEQFLDIFVSMWDRNPFNGRPGDTPPRSLLDALVARDYLERFLRPLSVPPAPSDVVHSAANGLGALVGMMAKWTHGTPFILTEHGIYLRERYLAHNSAHSWQVDAFMLRFFRHLTSAAYQIADLITPGNIYNQRWELESGARQSIIEPVYNGVDPEAFPQIEDEPDVPTVAWAGRVDPLKDLETLIRGFALVRKEIPEARLRMFGATPAGNEGYRQRCEDLVDELELRDAATFEGRIDDIADAYAAGHVVTLTSISEGFPYTLIEAMISGSATVSTDVGGVAEAVGDAGLLVPAREPQALADALVTLLSDDELRLEFRRAARARALDHFTLDEFLTAYRGIYDQLGSQGTWDKRTDDRPLEDAVLDVEASAEEIAESQEIRSTRAEHDGRVQVMAGAKGRLEEAVEE